MLRRIPLPLFLLAATACGRIGFSEQAAVDAGSADDATLVYGPCPGTSLDCTGAIDCHDFESGTFDEWSYDCDGDDFQCSPSIPETALEILTTPACNGTNIYRAYTEGGPGSRQNAYLGQRVVNEFIDEVFVRFAMRWPEGSNVIDTGVVLMPLEPPDSPNGIRFGFGDTNGEMRMRIRDTSYPFAAPTVADQWTCIELYVTPSKALVWIDDQQVFDFDGATMPVGVRLGAVTLGITNSSGDGATELLFDDFAISPNRIGCVSSAP